MDNWESMTKNQLLALPQRKWNNVKRYNTILLVSTRKKHSSGFNHYAVIGINPNEMEIAAYMDDMSLCNLTTRNMRIDCSMKGVFRFWFRHRRDEIIKFEIGESLSSVDITIVQE